MPYNKTMQSLFRYTARRARAGICPPSIWSLEYEMVADISARNMPREAGGELAALRQACRFDPQCPFCQACRSLRVVVEEVSAQPQPKPRLEGKSRGEIEVPSDALSVSRRKAASVRPGSASPKRAKGRRTSRQGSSQLSRIVRPQPGVHGGMVRAGRPPRRRQQCGSAQGHQHVGNLFLLQSTCRDHCQHFQRVMPARRMHHKLQAICHLSLSALPGCRWRRYREL